MCLYPTLIKNPKYKANKKNGGDIPPLPDDRVKYVPIGCQDCIECRKQKANEWQVRLLEDIKTNKMGKFITLTFSDQSIYELSKEIKDLTGYELDNKIATIGVRRFLERWRKQYKKSVRHWLITEIGHNGTENIHLHGIIWTEKSFEDIERHWKYGYIFPTQEHRKTNYVSSRTINYIVKYVTKKDEKHKTYKPVILTSAGIGRNYITKRNLSKNKFNGVDTDTTYRTDTGHKIGLPIYWRNKIYTDNEREKLWLQLLDKQERWICGEKIKIDKDEKDYYATLKHYRELNIRLGYGTGEKDWKLEQYEREQRQLNKA